jgi:ABC-type branched-subunit amino acid transport system ATPase component
MLLDASAVGVSFQGLRALDNFALTTEEGEFHGIIGPNGAGKTTALNVLTGFLPRNEGRIVFDGRPLPRASHAIAQAGIGRTFQSPTIFGALSPVENVMCGGHRWTAAGLFGSMLRSRHARQEERTLRAEATEWLKRVGFAYPPDAPVLGLPFGELRKLEIARALMGRPRLLMLDEPTAGLTVDEVFGIGRLLRSIRTERGKPLSIVLVEHNVPFVFSLCDRVTAVDKGVIVACGAPAEVRATRAVIDSYLGGGQAVTVAAADPKESGRRDQLAEARPLLEVRGLSAGYGRMTVVRGIDLDVRRGELIVLCGRNGAGKSTILNAIAGQPRPAEGEVSWLGQRIDGLSVSQIVRSGIGLVPQERGIIAGQTIDANLQLAVVGMGLGRPEFRERREAMFARFPKLRERHRQLAGTLSGGERQMLALAKVLIRRPQLMLLDEPTTGLAPTIIDELQRIVTEISNEGIALVVAEQNVTWIAPIASRAYLLEGGRIVASGNPDDIIRQEQVIESYLGQAQRQVEPERELMQGEKIREQS